MPVGVWLSMFTFKMRDPRSMSIHWRFSFPELRTQVFPTTFKRSFPSVDFSRQAANQLFTVLSLGPNVVPLQANAEAHYLDSSSDHLYFSGSF